MIGILGNRVVDLAYEYLPDGIYPSKNIAFHGRLQTSMGEYIYLRDSLPKGVVNILEDGYELVMIGSKGSEPFFFTTLDACADAASLYRR